jgi:hypothetical protein
LIWTDPRGAAAALVEAGAAIRAACGKVKAEQG